MCVCAILINIPRQLDQLSYYNPRQNNHMLIPKIYSKLIMILTIHYRQSYTKTHAMLTQHIYKTQCLLDRAMNEVHKDLYNDTHVASVRLVDPRLQKP